MNDNITVSAEAHSDDHKIELRFDATTWFEQATDEELSGLIAIKYGGDLESDRVAEFFENDQTKRLFDYLALKPTMGSDETVGFECNVDEVQAQAWLRKNRPHLIKDEYRFVVTGGINVPSDFEPMQAFNGDVIGFIMKDGRTVKLVVGFEIQSPETEPETYEYVCGDDKKTEAMGLTGLEYNETNFVLD